MTVVDYSTAGLLTDLKDLPSSALPTARTRAEICWPVHSLVIQPTDAEQLELPASRFSTNQIRPARQLLEALLALNQLPIDNPREPQDRVVGTCRHFAVLACAFLRHRGIASRVRCGFATYFQPDQGLDHWIVEHWDPAEVRWIRIDPEVLGGKVLARPDDLAPGEFLSGGEAWHAYRRGEIDPSTFGVYGTQNWGAAEIRGNAVKDLAALNKVEMLPWDEWGRMTEAYEGRTGPDYDDLLDLLADTCAENGPVALAHLYDHPDLTVPAALLS